MPTALKCLKKSLNALYWINFFCRLFAFLKKSFLLCLMFNQKSKKNMNHSQICHLFFSDKRKDTNQNRNIFISGNSIYSYGYHFPLAKEIEHKGKKYLFVNTASYSNSTSKHQGHLRNAINNNKYHGVYYFDFLHHRSYLGYIHSYDFNLNKDCLGQLIEKIIVDAKNSLFDLMKARTKLKSYNDFNRLQDLFDSLRHYFSELMPDNLLFPLFEDKHLSKVEKIRENKLLDIQKREEKRKKEIELQRKSDLEKLTLWLKHEYKHPLYSLPIHLRLSKDGQYIETTKGAKVALKPALIAYKAIISGKGIGQKIDGFTILETNLDFIKIGCHVIAWVQINNFLEANNLI